MKLQPYLLRELLGLALMSAGFLSCAPSPTEPHRAVNLPPRFAPNVSTLFGNKGTITELQNGDLQASDFTWKDSLGNPHTLQEVLDDGKIVVLNFWATWCTPCATELPVLAKLRAENAEDVVFIGVSLDATDSAFSDVLLYTTDLGLGYQQIVDPQGVLYYNYIRSTSVSIPQTFIINHSGLITYWRIGEISEGKKNEVQAQIDRVK